MRVVGLTGEVCVLEERDKVGFGHFPEGYVSCGLEPEVGLKVPGGMKQKGRG